MCGLIVTVLKSTYHYSRKLLSSIYIYGQTKELTLIAYRCYVAERSSIDLNAYNRRLRMH